MSECFAVLGGSRGLYSPRAAPQGNGKLSLSVQDPTAFAKTQRVKISTASTWTNGCVIFMGMAGLRLIGNEDEIRLKIAVSLGRSFAAVGTGCEWRCGVDVIGRDHERPGFQGRWICLISDLKTYCRGG